MRTISILLCAVLLLHCGGGPTEADYQFGRIDVYVRAEAGQPVDGVGVRLERNDGRVEDAGGLTGTAGLPGYYFFLRTSGSFRIAIAVPSGYALAPGQAASVPITFRRNETQTVTFLLQRT